MGFLPFCTAVSLMLAASPAALAQARPQMVNDATYALAERLNKIEEAVSKSMTELRSRGRTETLSFDQLDRLQIEVAAAQDYLLALARVRSLEAMVYEPPRVERAREMVERQRRTAQERIGWSLKRIEYWLRRPGDPEIGRLLLQSQLAMNETAAHVAAGGYMPRLPR